MYLNRIQQYILELLREYGCLKKQQLEVMTKHRIEGPYRNIDGYLNQLRIFKRIQMTEDNAYVMLPGKAVDQSLISAFDIMMEFKEYVVSHRRGTAPVAIRFYVDDDSGDAGEFGIIPVRHGYERAAEAYSNVNFSDGKCSAIFLINTKEQMDILRPGCRYSFAVKEGDEILFFDGA